MMLFPAGSLPPGPPIETKKALLLLDFQNDFVDPTGKLPVENVQSFISKLPSLASQFRAKGLVIWCGTEFKQTRSSLSPSTGSQSILLKQFLEDHQLRDETSSECHDDPDHTRSPAEDPLSPSSKPDLVHDREAFLAPTVIPTKYRCCLAGSRGAEYPEILRAAMDQEQDLISLKSHYSAFGDPSLLLHLRTMLITELYVCGSISNISVYATVLDAVCHGLQVTIVEDCLGFNHEPCHVEAMRQMADDMGANGIDYQELQDDLAGILGDVIHEEDFKTTFQVSLPPPSRRPKSHTSAQHINDWIDRLESESNAHRPRDSDGKPSNVGEIPNPPSLELSTKSESSSKPSEPAPADHSPPPKRPTRGLTPLGEINPPEFPSPHSTRADVDSVYLAEQKEQKQSIQTRKRRPSHESSTMPTNSNSLNQVEKSADKLGAEDDVTPDMTSFQDDDPDHENTSVSTTMMPKKKKKLVQDTLGPEDKIGQGDSHLYLDLLGEGEADTAFQACRDSIRWQKMFHRSGEVPRLVAVQGEVSDDGTEVPIYRHPADESPQLLPFDPVVTKLRMAAERIVKHPLNHVLIQWYRNSEDNISEHSDKSLDIVRGSNVVNISLGARRTMILRTKKSALTDSPKLPSEQTIRPSQRIPLPHNSLFVLGPETNQRWLHAIRADKRNASEKDAAELAFEGQRISLTFRHIGTFIDSVANKIWGQGATVKTREGAASLLTGTEAEQEGELLIQAFGQENHQSTDWDWGRWYGKGFDIVNYETKSG